MNKDSKILIVGHDDIIEKSLYRSLPKRGFTHVSSTSDMGLETSIQPAVYDYFQNERPEYVFLGSTRSGGIEANINNPADFIYHNCESQNNIIYAAHKFGAQKLLYFAGSCVYPKECAQPIKEEVLLTGSLEKTSEPYALSKIAGISLCQSYKKQYAFNAIVAVLATVYGAESDTNLETAHVMGALIGKFKAAIQEDKEEVFVWGTGTPKREFLYSDDFVEASIFLMEHYDGLEIINVGCGTDITIKSLAQKIADALGYKGKIVLDESKPDGAFQKLLDNSRITKLGWKAQVSLDEGIALAYGNISEDAKR